MTTEIEILQYLHYHPLSKRAEIGSKLTSEIGERTLKRIIADCVEKGYVDHVFAAYRYFLTFSTYRNIVIYTGKYTIPFSHL